ncbi:MAG: GNAT family N-acetyltransferase, partial [Pseudomonadota bacterium]|nr:GNAT family N-acetyltransferase [Pseudomonadota bacterium]
HERWVLYQRYQRRRHPGGGMDDGTVEDFREFLAAHWSPTRFLELRDGTRLLAVAVTDVGNAALSAVYTWFDPAEAARGLGTLAILQQIAYGRAHGLQHLYLGYWIAGHPKMDYKRRYRPLEVLGAQGWVAL